MPKTKYHLSFSENDIEKLNSVLSESNPDSKLHLRAKVLLALEQSTRIPATTLAIAKERGTSDTTVQSVKTKFALYGLDNALYAAKRETPPVTPKYTDAEAKIIALAQSVPPDGKKKWTVRLLTEYYAKLGFALLRRFSHTVSRQLKLYIFLGERKAHHLTPTNKCL